RPNGSSAVSRSALLSAPRTWPGVAGPLNDRVNARSVSGRQHDNLAPNDLAGQLRSWRGTTSCIRVTIARQIATIPQMPNPLHHRVAGHLLHPQVVSER